jgi:uncharacterized protein
MYFAVICLDKPDSLAIRLANRDAHLAFLAATPGLLKLGGPLLDAAGQMCGSMLVIECADEAAARVVLADDPYAKAGLFASVELRPYRPVVGAWAP